MIDTQNYELRQLAQELEGELDFSEATCTLYSTDASIYQQVPSGVAFPKTAADVQSLVEFASENNISVTPRGAGSSLTGNAIGEGLVIDSERYMDSIVQISPDKRQVTVEPGVILEDLNEELEEYGLQFGPNPSTSATCTIGGMVANDAAGPHSLRYGTTSENVVSVGVVLSDGTIGKFAQKSGSTLEQACTRDDLVGEVYHSLREIRTTHSDEIHKRYPEVDRNSTGYNLRDCGADDGQWVDPSTVISGSEGTLCYLTEITLSLDPLPEAKGTALLFYRSLEAAADAVSVLLEESPSAIELVDDAVLEYARDAWGYDLVPDEVGGALLVEVEGPQASISDRLTTVVDAGTATFSEDVIEVHQAESEEQRQVLWKIRKASNPLLNRQPGDQQALSFIEDAAIPPSKLPQYLDAVGTILQSHELRASVFGHAGQGVLHIKPFLNLKSEEDRKTLQAVSEEVHTLVKEFGGAVSGEHGDGLLRSQFVEDFYGPIVYQQLQTVKEIFDPVGVFNPDKVVPAGNKEPARMSASLRYEEYQPRSIQTAMDFSSEEGFGSLIEQCNGCSKCRTTGDGVMCPSYRGAKTEITSTRGRANLLRAAINGELDDDMLTSDWFQSEVLDLCLSCKACETECPTGVDMAKLKTEAKHQRHKEKGTSLQARIFGNVRVMNKIGSLTAPLANRLANFSPARILGEAILGIDRRRSLPEFHRHTLYDWMDRRSTTNEQGTPIVLYPDCYTTYNQPEVGKAAVKLLERLGYRVEIGDFECCGRPALSQGLVETAAGHAETNRDRFAQLPDETPVVSVEPSCVSAVNEYDDLIDDVSTSVAVQPLSSFLLSEASAGQIELPEIGNKKSVAYHGHCHAKAKGWSTATKDLLERVGYDVYPLDSTCCGMAGAFGYQTEHYDLSIEIAAKTINQLEQLDVECIATNGASCTHQLVDHGYDPVHPIELL